MWTSCKCSAGKYATFLLQTDMIASYTFCPSCCNTKHTHAWDYVHCRWISAYYSDIFVCRGPQLGLFWLLQWGGAPGQDSLLGVRCQLSVSRNPGPQWHQAWPGCIIWRPLQSWLAACVGQMFLALWYWIFHSSFGVDKWILENHTAPISLKIQK